MLKKYLASAFVVCSLTACGTQATTQKESTETSSQTTTVTTMQETTTTASVNSDQATDESGVFHNGSYYYVQGKYDEIPIINKKHPIAADYNPGENGEALAQFQKLKSDMQNFGFAISDNYSGFRSYEYQTQVYQTYVNRDGQVAVDTYSARPGYSEHQSGLAFDLMDTSGNLLVDSAATTWLAQNAHEYGFIVRYIADKESITGYQAETWHVRYVGQEATEIYQSGLTLEEYFGVEGGDYAE
ncbi:LD-carboxypeptidase LdcB/DacB [Streptococcus caprae]|uniref:LD-carboxypeptidase LdcB/DacB n=1 Tax=Streptococcus caprae TaxID=1640501 RepID=A0ABV8CTV2_9STRE